ncbi:GAF domain-containing protein [Phormidium sp. CLA17]|uniref:sensor histidine kinase n=1 Tax=Leptolyngbya sp. Cla-17 TaxID=2803751 RepID=UPI001491479B|nr:ATP-binding protein [Leptolyngbya sp. Cla-17]MBM0743715.1 GAF domain-containing protein [Leptolyngbya sp. Cla-17]
MPDLIQNFLSSNGFIPHGHCYLWRPGLVGLHLMADAAIAVAYFSISILLFHFVRKREDLPFNRVFLLFGAFIIACGTTHLMEIWTLWHPIYWVTGVIKLGTGIISLYTAAELVYLIPQALALPSPAQLEVANRDLQQQILKRQQVEAALQRESEFLNAVLENIEDGVVACDAEGILMLFNRATQEFHAVSKAPLSAEQWASHYDLYLPNGTTLMSKEEVPLFRALQDTLVCNVEMVIAPKNRPKRSLLASGRAIFNSQGHKLGAVVSMHDITERKQAEEVRQQYTAQLQQALDFEALLKRITDKVRDSLDEAQILQTVVNELGQGLGVSYCSVTLYNLEQRTATVCYEYTPLIPSRHGRILQMTERPKVYSQLQQGECFQLCAIAPDTISGQGATLVCPIFDDQGVLGDLWLMNHQDYAFPELELRLVQQVASHCAISTRQARLYQASQAQIEELEKLNCLKDDFLSTVSHELRTPMSNIKMAIQMLEISLEQMDEFKSSQNKAAQYFRILQDECHREIDLINDLLDLTRLDSETDPLMPFTIQLQSWLGYIAEPFEARMLENQQRFEITVPPDLPPLITDQSYLERVMTELLNNACKYTPPGGTIQVTAKATSSELQISVTNSGVEISESELPHVFDKFYRIANDDPWKHGGTGLGLALTKKLMERLNGSISAFSDANQTQFVLVFPLNGGL